MNGLRVNHIQHCGINRRSRDMDKKTIENIAERVYFVFLLIIILVAIWLGQ